MLEKHMGTYKSCRCRNCRSVSAGAKRWHKREGHRKLRRQTRLDLAQGKEPQRAIGTGYLA